MPKARLMTIRPATLADLVPLHALIERAYRGDTARQGWTSEDHLLSGTRTSAAALTAQINDPDTVLLVDDQMRACVQVTNLRNGRAYLGQLAVDPVLQGKGLGRAMLDAAKDHAYRHFGASFTEMSVIDVRTELLAWYGRLGYLPNGETRPMPAEAGPSTQPIVLIVLERQLP